MLVSRYIIAIKHIKAMFSASIAQGLGCLRGRPRPLGTEEAAPPAGTVGPAWVGRAAAAEATGGGGASEGTGGTLNARTAGGNIPAVGAGTASTAARRRVGRRDLNLLTNSWVLPRV